MKPFLLNYLVCPVDGGELSPKVIEQRRVQLTAEQREKIKRRGLAEHQFETEIISGFLLNDRKKILYPIYNGVPRLLIFRHALLDEFIRKFWKEVSQMEEAGYRFSDDDSIPGEKNVLKSFSSEWTDYGYNEEAYWGQTAEVYNNSLYSTLENNDQSLADKLVLEVGIGSGGSANFMSKKFDCNLIGVDLGYSVDVAFKNFNSNPFLHVVQASAFHLPFSNETFDFVYSHGVIHHTYNTKRAFDQLSKLPKKGGRLYVWVYSFLNETRTSKRKAIMFLERVIRPWCSELPGWLQTIALQPIVPLYIFHQNSVYKGRNGMARYSWREALHAARDRFTPKFIHRHSEEEVIKWFEHNHFVKVRPLSKKQLPAYVPEGFYMNTGVEGFRS